MYSIIIDGPIGSGKSTIAEKISKDIGYFHFNINAIRKVIAYCVLHSEPNDENIRDILSKIKIKIKRINNKIHYFLNDEDITLKITDISLFDTILKYNIINSTDVKDFILNLIKNISEKTNIIIEGTNINYYTLPNTTHKIFLTASIEKRIERKYKDMIYFDIKQSFSLDFNKFKSLLSNYDLKTSTIALKDAVCVDNSEYNIDKTYKEIMKILQFNKTFSCIIANTVGDLKEILKYVPDTRYVKFGTEKYGFEINKAIQDKYSLVLQSSDMDYIFKEVVLNSLSEFNFGEKTTNYKNYKNALSDITVQDIVNLSKILENISEGNNEMILSFKNLIKVIKTEEKCPKCGALLFKSDIPQYNYTCSKCNNYF